MFSGKSQPLAAVVVGLMIFAPLLALPGCTSNETEPSPSSSTGSTAGATGDSALIAAGQKVFEANGCGNCHAVGGQGGGRAPDLSKVGAEAEHTSQWLVEHIKNPKKHNPNSKMPPFEGKINDKDLLAIGAYLASLK